MNTPLHFVSISGRLRQGSWNTMLLNAFFSLLPADVTMERASIADLPLYNADNDLPAAAKVLLQLGISEMFSQPVIISPGIITPFPRIKECNRLGFPGSRFTYVE